MASYVLPRVLHVLSIVLWIGGVAFVTTVLLPSIARLKTPEERVAFFEMIEGRFAWQSRVTTLLAGASGFYLVYEIDAWSWFLEPSRWYLHVMVLVWLLFTLMLFVLEPLVLGDLFQRRSKIDPEGTFRFISRMHWVLLSISLLAVAGAVAGAHGWLLHP